METASSGAVSYTLSNGPRISGGSQRFEMVSRATTVLKTLPEIDPQPGDCIRWHKGDGMVSYFEIAEVRRGPGLTTYVDTDLFNWSGTRPQFEMVSRAAGQPSTPAPALPTAQPALARTAAYWSAHLDHPVSADDVRTMLRLHELANGATVTGV